MNAEEKSFLEKLSDPEQNISSATVAKMLLVVFNRTNPPRIFVVQLKEAYENRFKAECKKAVRARVKDELEIVANLADYLFSWGHGTMIFQSTAQHKNYTPGRIKKFCEISLRGK